MAAEPRIAVAYVDDRHLRALRKLAAAQTSEAVMSALCDAQTWIGPRWLDDLARVLERVLERELNKEGHERG